MEEFEMICHVSNCMSVSCVLEHVLDTGATEVTFAVFRHDRNKFIWSVKREIKHP